MSDTKKNRNIAGMTSRAFNPRVEICFMRILALIFSFCLFSSISEGQVTSQFPPEPIESIAKPYCEDHERKLEWVMERIGAESYLIVVSHLGSEEKASISSRRLYNAKAFFTTLPHHRPNVSVLTASGERVKGIGRLDFFAEGKLLLRINLNKNADFVVTSCVIDPPGSRCSSARERLFYPCKR